MAENYIPASRDAGQHPKDLVRLPEAGVMVLTLPVTTGGSSTRKIYRSLSACWSEKSHVKRANTLQEKSCIIISMASKLTAN